MWTKIKNWIKDKWLKFKKWILALFLLPVAFAANEIILDQTKNEVSLEKVSSKYQQSVEIKSKYTLEASALVKTDIKNPALDAYKHEPKDEIEVSLGDTNSQEFTPSISLSRWRETSFKLKPKGLDTVATKDKDLTFEGDRVKFKTPKMDFEMYDVPATANDEGGYKYVWYLNEAPAKNVVEFDIETSGLEFFYQPPLWQEAGLKAPTLDCTDTDCNGSHRPENVVGSYAVYHSTKGGMNDKDGKEYKTGKAFHIFRPHIIDANGAETWGILHIENGIYSVEIPQEFLDTAVYPIKSNDTFGWSNAGASGNNIASAQPIETLIVVSATPSGGNGTLDKLTAYLGGTGSTDVKGLVYQKDSGGANIHGIIDSGIYTDVPSATGWRDITLTSQSITNGTAYLIGAIGDDAKLSGIQNFQMKFDNSAGVVYTSSDMSYTSPTNPWTRSMFTGVKFSIYATYQASTPAITPVMMIID